MKITGNIQNELKEMVMDFYDFAKPYMKFDKDVTKTNFVSDNENAKKILGMTGYYNPEDYSVTIYTDRRHPKDILRSLAHELVHHAQNCKGEFNDGSLDEAAEEGYAQVNPKLRSMEKQAMLIGNICFRDWEDGIKTGRNNSKAPSYIVENRERYIRLLNQEQNGLLMERALKTKWNLSEAYEDRSVEPNMMEAIGGNFDRVNALAKRYQQTQEDSDLEVLKQAFEENVVPMLSQAGLDYKGFHKYDAMLKRETVAVFRALKTESDYKVARVHIDLDPLTKLFSTSVETDHNFLERDWNRIEKAVEYIKRALGQGQEPIETQEKPSLKENTGMKNVPKAGKFKYTKKITKENIANIVESYMRKLKESKGTLGQTQINEMVANVVRFMMEQNDKNMKPAQGKPAGAMVQEQGDKNMKPAQGKPTGAMVQEQGDKNMKPAQGKPKGAMVQESDGANEYKYEKAGNKPKGSLVEEDLDKLVNEVLGEFNESYGDVDPSAPWSSADEFGNSTPSDAYGPGDTFTGNPRDAGLETDVNNYADTELGMDEDIVPPTPDATNTLTAEPEPNWLYGDEPLAEEKEIYERCAPGSKDKLYEGRHSRTAKKLLSWAVR